MGFKIETPASKIPDALARSVPASWTQTKFPRCRRYSAPDLDAGGVADLIIAQGSHPTVVNGTKIKANAKPADDIRITMLPWAICRDIRLNMNALMENTTKPNAANWRPA